MRERFFAWSLGYVAFCALPCSAGEPQQREEPAELRARIRINTLEAAVVQEHFERQVKWELDLCENIRACIESGDERLPQYQQTHQRVQAELEATKKQLIALEVDNAR